MRLSTPPHVATEGTIAARGAHLLLRPPPPVVLLPPRRMASSPVDAHLLQGSRSDGLEDALVDWSEREPPLLCEQIASPQSLARAASGAGVDAIKLMQRSRIRTDENVSGGGALPSQL